MWYEFLLYILSANVHVATSYGSINLVHFWGHYPHSCYLLSHISSYSTCLAPEATGWKKDPTHVSRLVSIGTLMYMYYDKYTKGPMILVSFHLCVPCIAKCDGSFICNNYHTHIMYVLSLPNINMFCDNVPIQIIMHWIPWHKTSTIVSCSNVKISLLHTKCVYATSIWFDGIWFDWLMFNVTFGSTGPYWF